MRHYLKSGSLLAILCFLAACASPYRALKPAVRKTQTALWSRPVFTKELYRCMVDGRFLLKRFHLSGLLLFRQLPDSSTRVVFQNEMGFSFFDFAWDRHDSFSVKQIIPQLDKPAVIRTLEKDIRLLLMKGLEASGEQYFERGGEIYHRFSAGKGYAWYIEKEGQLARIEYAGRRKITTITPVWAPPSPASSDSLALRDHQSVVVLKTFKGMPDSVLFRHHRAHFTIRLHKIREDAAE